MVNSQMRGVPNPHPQEVVIERGGGGARGRGAAVKLNKLQNIFKLSLLM